MISHLKITCFWIAVLSFARIQGTPISGQQPSVMTFFVSPKGSDNDPGTRSRPMSSIQAAVDAARHSSVPSKKIIVLPGDYYINKPIELDARDNGLTIESDTTGKATIYGGTSVTGWKRDGDKFWYADMPGVKDGSVDFRAIVVNGTMPLRARMPESGTFTHLNSFNVPWLESIGGGFARKPTKEELTVMKYNPEDVPASLDVRNAEVRVYHSWDESLVGVEKNDTENHRLIFSSPTVYPAGAGSWPKTYVIWNTREGMSKPGRWYLDRTNGRLIYWPLEGEDMTCANVIAPLTECLIIIKGDPDNKAENITIRGLILQATTTPLKSPGMGAVDFEGAIDITCADKCSIERMEICNVGGVGISGAQLTDCKITDCHIHNIGGGGTRIDGTGLFFARNHIHDVGVYYSGALGIQATGSHNHIFRNEIHDAPYSGIIVSKSYILVEENLIYRVMNELHDGAAIYGIGLSNCFFRSNIARDIRTIVKGSGARSYYLDEGSHDCIIENNVSIGVSEPVQSYIARNSIIRNNLFMTEENMKLTFTMSADIRFEGNTLYTSGKIAIESPDAITSWKNNIIFSGGNPGENSSFVIDTVKPGSSLPSPRNWSLDVKYVDKAPIVDGEMGDYEWPGEFKFLDRNLSRQIAGGAPVAVKLARDKKNLYIGALIIMFDNNNISKGKTWGKNDGMEISIEGSYKGKPAIFVIRGYSDGTLQCVTDAGAPSEAAQNLNKKVVFVSRIMESNRKGWSGEWSVPLDALGIKSQEEMKIPFNMCAFVNEYNKWHCWEGTLGNSWEVDKAARLQFK